jgi:hypothetical protein
MHRTLPLVLVLGVVPAAAQERQVSYEGAPMTALVRGDSIEIRYLNPPPNLRELGVTPGTPLLRGQWEGGIFTGDAFVFAPGCPPVPFPVRGMIDNNGALLVLGPAPTAVKDCQAEALAWNERSILRFEQPTFSKPKPQAKPKPKPKPKPKVEPPRSRPAPAPRVPWENQWQWQWR